MSRRSVLGVVVLAALLVLTAKLTANPDAFMAAGRQSSGADASSQSAVGPVVQKYCVTCHNGRLKTGGLALDAMDFGKIPANAAVWEKVIRQLRTGAMPPLGMPRPDDAAREALVTAIETSLDRAVAANPYPGHPSVHRLNRAEYGNAIRDLLALDIDPAAYLPADDSSSGFDNIGEALALSSALLERYVSAAGEIATLAVGNAEDVAQTARVFQAPADFSQDKRNEGLPFGTTGGFMVKLALPLDGEYVLKANLLKTALGLPRGLEFPRQLQFIVDGEPVFSITIGGEASFVALLQDQTVFSDALEAKLQARIPLKAGPHAIGATFVSRAEVVNTRRLKAVARTTSDSSETLLGPPHVTTLTLTGPFDQAGPGDTPSRQRIFTCRPVQEANEEPCARTILAALARRAFRGKESRADVQELIAFYRKGRDGGTFDRGVALALQRILVSPKFLVRIEEEPDVADGAIYRVRDLDLASRLSFFLWSSIPDDQLLQLASDGRLANSAVLAQQVQRMLADPKSQALVSNFAGQWLQLRNLKSSIPDSQEFPDFDDQLRQGFRRETEMFVGSIVRENRSVLDLLTADYTFVNERVAKHYGIPHIYGNEFRRVTVTDEARKGLLGQGSILTVTSHADRTSPVVRGKWILENLLGAKIPPPPPNVPPLKQDEEVSKPMTMRQRMEEHRRNPACASCHRKMDPVGFALENFDAVGAWRAMDRRIPIDTTGQFVDGSPIDGPLSLRQAILHHPANFVTTFTEKLLTYALGRGLDERDMPTVRVIVRESARQDYRLMAIVQGIVRSAPFQKRIKVAAETETVTR